MSLCRVSLGLAAMTLLLFIALCSLSWHDPWVFLSCKFSLSVGYRWKARVWAKVYWIKQEHTAGKKVVLFCSVFYYCCLERSLITWIFQIRFCLFVLNDHLKPTAKFLLPLQRNFILLYRVLSKFDHCSVAQKPDEVFLLNFSSLRVTNWQLIRNHTVSCNFTLIHLCRIIPLKTGSGSLGNFNWW